MPRSGWAASVISLARRLLVGPPKAVEQRVAHEGPCFVAGDDAGDGRPHRRGEQSGEGHQHPGGIRVRTELALVDAPLDELAERSQGPVSRRCSSSAPTSAASSTAARSATTCQWPTPTRRRRTTRLSRSSPRCPAWDASRHPRHPRCDEGRRAARRRRCASAGGRAARCGFGGFAVLPFGRLGGASALVRRAGGCIADAARYARCAPCRPGQCPWPSSRPGPPRLGSRRGHE